MAHLNLIVIKTDKLPEQSRFYTALGFQFDYHQHGNGPFHYTSVGSAPVLELYPQPKGIVTLDVTTRLGFVVDNLEQTIKTLREMGAVIVSEPAQQEWGYAAVIQDLDGRKIDLTEDADDL
ncbi:MAG: glyoxalase/bleomycin resistance/extradiol dioxygenase family protein [Chitinophaga sp.]|uniref:VOC family protein n=1 Tax=Chitinophaga sp. TaxID=1869181 RepID=UPI0025B9F3DF|nr:VOC family protein [Chitinophaga sp.]MBV8251348.1 glyoxalase/bleomycin resistance/extradiol dioxygenase family protein [Chitinophaga sp.]